jgi:hypothetical protein
MELRFDYGGKTYGLDLDDELPVHEARLIKQYAGMTVTEFMEGFQKGDVDAICGVVLLGVRRGGGEVEWADLDSLDLVELMQSMSDPNGTPLAELAASGQTPELPEAMNRAARRAKPSSNGNGQAPKPAPRKRAATR